ncbi:hypothetical protein [Rudaea sp.]|uniref:hypothetical protein n=1 Tax=Rudaea sp. TaxID=2136325 RepID=UPI003783F34F
MAVTATGTVSIASLRRVACTVMGASVTSSADSFFFPSLFFGAVSFDVEACVPDAVEVCATAEFADAESSARAATGIAIRIAPASAQATPPKNILLCMTSPPDETLV